LTYQFSFPETFVSLGIRINVNPALGLETKALYIKKNAGGSLFIRPPTSDRPVALFRQFTV